MIIATKDNRVHVLRAISNCLVALSMGLHRADAETEEYAITAYAVGEDLIRVDIKKKVSKQ